MLSFQAWPQADTADRPVILPDQAFAGDSTEDATEDSTRVIGQSEPYTLDSLSPLPIPERKASAPKGWFFILNCFLLGLLVVKFAVFHVYSRKAWNAWINENLFYQFIREKTPVGAGIVFVESLLKIYAISILILMSMELFVPGYQLNLPDLIRMALLVVAFYVAKTLLSLLLAWLTDQFEIYKIMNLHAILFASNASYFIIPLLLAVAYMSLPWKIYGQYAVLGIFLMAIMFLIFRSLRIFLKVRMAFNLHFFLYLCAFEIIPYLVLVKILEERVVH
jgi:hypothetical protein